MTATTAREGSPAFSAPPESVRTYAKLAGLLGLISVLAGGFGEAYVPSVVIVSGDAAATARNISASSSLVRCGFASYLVEALCDVGLTTVSPRSCSDIWSIDPSSCLGFSACC